jgi:hypothetical protein
MTNIVWQTQPKIDEKYLTFYRPVWPVAYFKAADYGFIAAELHAPYKYDKKYEHEKDVGFDIKIIVTIPDVGPFRFRTLKKRARSIEEAKQLISDFYDAHPEFISHHYKMQNLNDLEEIS